MNDEAMKMARRIVDERFPDSGTRMAYEAAYAAIIETRDRIVEGLSAEYDQLMADAKYLHSHGSCAASELFDKAAHNHRIAAAIRSGQQFRKDGE